MRQTTYTDSHGRKFEVLLPVDSDNSQARHGLRLGPPDLSPLGLPLDVEVRLNNELHRRGIITLLDANTQLVRIQEAVNQTLRMSAGKIRDLYRMPPEE